MSEEWIDMPRQMFTVSHTSDAERDSLSQSETWTNTETETETEIGTDKRHLAGAEAWAGRCDVRISQTGPCWLVSVPTLQSVYTVETGPDWDN